MGVAKGALGP